MVFSSHLFLFYFLPLMLLLYYLLPFRARTALIAAGSYLFYGWANPPWARADVSQFGGVDYVCGLVCALANLPLDGELPPIIPKEIPRTKGQKAALIISITSNMGLLAFFKYYDFTAENLNALSHALGMGNGGVPILNVILPVGISFYTFKSMSYAIDVYRGDARAMFSFTDFCCFEAFFPDLVAGPIVRDGAIEQQMRSRATYARQIRPRRSLLRVRPGQENPDRQSAGACRRYAPSAAGSLHWYDAWFGVIGYAFRIYFDFSGYSDMAIGLALMMGFVLIQNFNSPYQAD